MMEYSEKGKKLSTYASDSWLDAIANDHAIVCDGSGEAWIDRWC